MKKIVIRILKSLGLYSFLLKKKHSIDRKKFEAAERQNAKKRRPFYAAIIQPGDLVFDVGANIGNRVEVFLELQANVIAVEPQPDCAAILQNKFGNRIIIEQVGLAGKDGEMEMFIADESTISTFSSEFIEKTKEKKFSRNTWERKEIVKITTLDALVRKHGRPAFCKIDVEGFEPEVLKGLSAPIKKISFEYNIPEMTTNLHQCLEILHSLSPGYRYNFSVGENMQFELDSSLAYDQFMQLIKQPVFANTDFGDVYAFIKE